jgi:hypothetical protein
VRTADAPSMNRVFDTPHNPFRTRQAVETPQNYVELYQRYRYYYKIEPVIGMAIDLHAQFPLSTFDLEHEDAMLQNEFQEEIVENLNIVELLSMMAHEYWLVGECFPFLIWDDVNDPQTFESWKLINPLNIELQKSFMTDGRPDEVIKLKIDETTKTIISNGPNHAKTGILYNRMPREWIDACTKGDGTLNLNHEQISHFKRKEGNYFDPAGRGESIIRRVLHLLTYRDVMRDAQYAIASRAGTPREVWKIGETNNPASGEELSAFSQMLAQSFFDPTQAIVYHHALQVDVIGSNDKLLPIRQELDAIEDEMLMGLMLNKGFLDNSYGAYANTSVSLDILIARYLDFRRQMETWMKQHVFEPICRRRNIYKPTQAELEHRIRTNRRKQTPWVPKVTWHKHELRDATQKMNLLMMMREKLGFQGSPGLPKEMIYRSMNMNPKIIEQQLKKEASEAIINQAGISLQGAPGIAGAGGLPNMSVDIGGGMGGAAGGGGGEVPNSAPNIGGNPPAGMGNVPSGDATSQNVAQTGTGL